MRYFSIDCVVNAYRGYQGSMTNKSWGVLSIMKHLPGLIKPSKTYAINCSALSSYLEKLFCVSNSRKDYFDNGKYWYVKFSTQWKDFFRTQGQTIPNIFDVLVWAYRDVAFPDEITNAELISKFLADFHIGIEELENTFTIQNKALSYNDYLYSEEDLLSKLSSAFSGISGKNLTAEARSVAASPGELSRGPFIQPLYAALDTPDYILISMSNFDDIYPNDSKIESRIIVTGNIDDGYRTYITAIKSKPFLLLAGISGTGKSRIVRELARACWDEGSEEFKAQKPKNFEIVQVKPNWHDSSELIGYVSRIGVDKDGNPRPVFVAGDFLKFVAKAWENPEVPYFLCLDEMNLAPVEQYFAEYLSVVESRKCQEDGTITTDPILKKCDEQWFFDFTAQLTKEMHNDDIRNRFNSEGISIPQNLIVVGTVNMDETTFSFSRKVLDRAMTIEMNEVNLYGGLDSQYEKIGKLEASNLIGTAVEGVDVYKANEAVCNTALKYLEAVNAELEGTPFKVAYRTRNEFLLYVVNNLPYNKDKDGNELGQNFVIARALDEITSMKILSRIEGDETKIGNLLDRLTTTIGERLKAVSEKEYSAKKDDSEKIYSVSLAKLKEMSDRLNSGYTSFWS